MFLYNSVSPVRLRRMQGTDGRPIDLANNELIKNGMGVTDPSPKISLNTAAGVSIHLLNDMKNGAALYEKLLIFVGEARRELMDVAVESDDYESQPGPPGIGSFKAAYLDKILTYGLKVGKYRFAEWLSEQDIDIETYGEKAATLLDTDTLQTLLEDMEQGYLSGPEEALLEKAGDKGIPSRNPIKPPTYEPNI